MRQWITKNGEIVTQLLGGRSNVFLLAHNDRFIVVDTSPGYRWKKLDRRLKSLNISKIDYLLLTHTHFDHAGSSERLRQSYDAKVFVHKSEAGYLTSGNNPPVYGTNRYTRTIVRILAKAFLKKVKYQPCSCDCIVDSSFDLSESGFNAGIIHTPGHSPGSMSLIVNNEIAIVGDCMFGVFKTSAFPPFAYDPKQMVESWGKLLDTGCTTFLPSHGREKNREQLLNDYNKYNKIFETKS